MALLKKPITFVLAIERKTTMKTTTQTHEAAYIQALKEIKGFSSVSRTWIQTCYAEGLEQGHYEDKAIIALNNNDSIIAIHRKIGLPEMFKNEWYYAPDYIPNGGVFELSTYIQMCENKLAKSN